MIWVYTGPQSSITIPNIKQTFDKGVPTWLPTNAEGELDAATFRRYNPDIHGLPDNCKRILVFLPTDFEMAVCAITCIHRIREMFPANEILVLTTEKIKPLLPSFCIFIDKLTKGPEKFYRTFDLKQKRPYFITPLHMSRQTIEALFMQSIGLWDTNEDVKLYPLIREKGKRYDKESKTIAVIPNGLKMSSTWVELRDSIEESGLGPFDFEFVTGDMENLETLKTDLDILTSADVIISCGDSPLTFVGVHYGIPTFAHLMSGFKVFMLAQYVRFFGEGYIIDEKEWGTVNGKREPVVIGEKVIAEPRNLFFPMPIAIKKGEWNYHADPEFLERAREGMLNKIGEIFNA